MFRTIFSLSLIQHQVIIEANPELSYGPITAISNSLVWQISPTHASRTHPYRINNFAMSYGRLAKSSTWHDWHFYLIRMTTWVAGWGGGVVGGGGSYSFHSMPLWPRRLEMVGQWVGWGWGGGGVGGGGGSYSFHSMPLWPRGLEMVGQWVGWGWGGGGVVGGGGSY